MLLLAVIAALQLFVIALHYERRDQWTGSGLNLPLPDQVAALTLALEQAGPAQQALVLRAVNGSELSARLLPAAAFALPEGRAAPRLEQRIRRYLAAMDDPSPQRMIATRLALRDGLLAQTDSGPRFDGTLSVYTGLAGGEVLEVRVQGRLGPRVFGLPLGFGAGMVGFLVAAVAILVLARELRPLVRLAHAVERFGDRPEPIAIREKGAREVRVLIRAINRMQARIAGLLANRSFMLAAVSHDLRTCLTRLRLRMEMISDEPTRERAGRDVEAMQALIDDALVLARSALVGTAAEPVDVNAVCGQLCDDLRHTGLPVQYTPPRIPAPVLGDAAAIRRVLGNLIDNAVTYGQRAEVCIRVTDGRVNVIVDDTGPGIPADRRETMLEPFRRLEPSRNREQGGSGLGLAIAAQLATAMNGAITLGDRPGGGARVTFSLPIKGSSRRASAPVPATPG